MEDLTRGANSWEVPKDELDNCKGRCVDSRAMDTSGTGGNRHAIWEEWLDTSKEALKRKGLVNTSDQSIWGTDVETI